MLYQIASLVLNVVAGLFAGACLLRAYMQYMHIPFSSPLGHFVLALSGWLVIPLQRIIKSGARWDWSSLLAAWLIVAVKTLLLWLVVGAPGNGVSIVFSLSILGLLSLAASGLFVLILVYAILSWFSAISPLNYLLGILLDPLLKPLRRVIPLLGGIDLSPLVAMLLLQIVYIVLIHFQRSLLF